jgi:hypothetical protein
VKPDAALKFGGAAERRNRSGLLRFSNRGRGAADGDGQPVSLVERLSAFGRSEAQLGDTKLSRWIGGTITR